VKGKTRWINSNTVIFEPDHILPSGTDYEVRFDLAAVTKVPVHFSTFAFNFSTVAQDYNVYIDGLTAIKSSDLTKQKLDGRLITADIVDSSRISEMLTAIQGGKRLPVSWKYRGPLEFRFTVDEIDRGKKASEVQLNWKGSPIGVTRNSSQNVEVPALGD